MTTLCHSVVATANSRCPNLKHKAQFIQKTFSKVFTLFAETRAIYDSSKILSDRDISELGKVLNTGKPCFY